MLVDVLNRQRNKPPLDERSAGTKSLGPLGSYEHIVGSKKAY